MVQRRWTQSWLTGTQDPAEAESYPGERLGRPEAGPGSVASMGRRLLALLIDWLLSMIIAIGVFHNAQRWTIIIFAAEVYLLTALTGVTVGKRLLGLRVIRVDGRLPGFAWAFVRTVLLLTVIPALITDRDVRGLHDRAANTIVIRS